MEEYDVYSINYYYNFKCDDLSCSANSLDEFIEVVYGTSNFNLISMQIISRISSGEKLRINYLNQFSASATNRLLLSDFAEKIKSKVTMGRDLQCSAEEKQLSNKNCNTTIVVQGNNNIVANNNGCIMQEKTKTERKSNLKNYLYNVFEGVSINAVWAGIVMIATLIAGMILGNS